MIVTKFVRFTWLGDSNKYPKVKSIRYPKERSINPNVTVYVVDLSVLKYINKVQIRPPSSSCNDSYVGNMIWLSPTDLSVTFTNREQTSASTVLCRAPTFNCTEVRKNCLVIKCSSLIGMNNFQIHSENIVENGWVLPADKTIFVKTDAYFRNRSNSTHPTASSISDFVDNDETSFSKNEFEMSGFMLKRLPVRDGVHGYYRHVVFVSMFDMRTVPLTMGRFEVKI